MFKPAGGVLRRIRQSAGTCRDAGPYDKQATGVNVLPLPEKRMQSAGDARNQPACADHQRTRAMPSPIRSHDHRAVSAPMPDRSHTASGAFRTGEPQPERRRSILRLLPLVRASVIQNPSRASIVGNAYLVFAAVSRQFDLLGFRRLAYPSPRHACQIATESIKSRATITIGSVLVAAIANFSTSLLVAIIISTRLHRSSPASPEA